MNPKGLWVVWSQTLIVALELEARVMARIKKVARYQTPSARVLLALSLLCSKLPNCYCFYRRFFAHLVGVSFIMLCRCS